MEVYRLPDLDYDYGALEPHLSARVVKLHHDKHHAAYVNTANETLEKLAAARSNGELANIGALERKLAFNVSGHVLHSLYWKNMAPGGGEPEGDLLRALQRDFGGAEALRKELSVAATTIMGSGWAALLWDGMAGRLVTAQLQDHQSQTVQGGMPLLVIDAWEHAYYLQYQTDKDRYVQAFWHICNWADVGQRLALAQRNSLGLGKRATDQVATAPLH
jgi:Fe-Mn family superoxide dismutase